MAQAIQIRDAMESDFCQITEIYNHYIKTSIATFEEQEVTTTEMISRYKTITDIHNLPYIIATLKEQIVGYAYAGPLKLRSAFRFAVENTIYISPNHSRKGFGKALVQATMDELKKRRIKAMLASISIPLGMNVEEWASCALHMTLGCRTVGRFEKVGVKFGKWIDVVWLQVDLEERGDDLEESQRGGGWTSNFSN
jgi:L-amino acid N-acyltransferase YncA